MITNQNKFFSSSEDEPPTPDTDTILSKALSPAINLSEKKILSDVTNLPLNRPKFSSKHQIESSDESDDNSTQSEANSTQSNTNSIPENNSSDEDFTNIRLFRRNFKPLEIAKLDHSKQSTVYKFNSSNVSNRGRLQIQDSSSGDENSEPIKRSNNYQKKSRASALNAASLMKLKSETEKLVRENVGALPKVCRKKVGLREFMEDEDENVGQVILLNKSNSVTLPVNNLTPTTAQLRRNRAQLIRERKKEIQSQTLNIPGATCSLVTFNLNSDEDEPKQQSKTPQKFFNPKLPFGRRNSKQFKLTDDTSHSSGYGSNQTHEDKNFKSKSLDCLVKIEDPETGTIKLHREKISIPTENVKTVQPMSKSALKKKILKMKIDGFKKKDAKHAENIIKFNTNENSNIDFDEFEESYLQNAQHKDSQLHHYSSQKNLKPNFLRDPDESAKSFFGENPTASVLWQEQDVDDELTKLLSSGHSRSSEQVESLKFIDGESTTSQDVKSAIRKSLNLPSQKCDQFINLNEQFEKKDENFEDDIEEMCSEEFPVKSGKSVICSDSEEEIEADSSQTINENSSDSDSDEEFMRQIQKRRLEINNKVDNELNTPETENLPSCSESESNIDQDEAPLTIKRTQKQKRKKLLKKSAKQLFATEADLSDDEEVGFNERKKFEDESGDDGSELDEYEEEENDEILKEKSIIAMEIAEKFKKQEMRQDAEEVALLKERYVKSDSEDEYGLDLPVVDRFVWNDVDSNSDNLLMKQAFFNSDSDEGKDGGGDIPLIDPKLLQQQRTQNEQNKFETANQSSFTLPPDETAINLDDCVPNNNPNDTIESIKSTILPTSTPLFNIPTATLQVNKMGEYKESNLKEITTEMKQNGMPAILQGKVKPKPKPIKNISHKFFKNFSKNRSKSQKIVNKIEKEIENDDLNKGSTTSYSKLSNGEAAYDANSKSGKIQAKNKKMAGFKEKIKKKSLLTAHSIFIDNTVTKGDDNSNSKFGSMTFTSTHYLNEEETSSSYSRSRWGLSDNDSKKRKSDSDLTRDANSNDRLFKRQRSGNDSLGTSLFKSFAS